MRKRKTLLATVGLLCCVPAAHGQNAVPVGEVFQINSYTTGFQDNAAVAALTDGGFAAFWTSLGSSDSDSPGLSIQGRRYREDGTPWGEQFQVNAFAPGFQQDPAAAGLVDGGFVVVWDGYGPEPGNDVRGQRYRPDGLPLGGEFQLNTHTSNWSDLDSSVAAFADGGFVAVWASYASAGSDTSGSSIQGRRYAADGTALDAEQFQVNSNTLGNQWRPTVATLAGGGFVAVWYESGIQGQRFADDGTPLGAEFQINSNTGYSHRRPSVAALADGGFVVVWDHRTGSSPDSYWTHIKGRRFAADGTALVPEFAINSTTEAYQYLPSVAASAGGGFVVVWTKEASGSPDSPYDSIQGRRYAADGTALGSQLQINPTDGGAHSMPSVATVAGGEFVVAWRSNSSSGPDSSYSGIQGQRLASPRFAFVGFGGKCLDVEGAIAADGTSVNLFRCHGGENQRWRLDLTAAPQRFVGLGGKCLVPGPDERVVIGECGGVGVSDLWQLITTGPSSPSALMHVETGLCLDVEGAVAGDGTPTQLFACHGGANQVWRPAPEVCTPDSQGLCLGRERFRVDLEWRSFDGTTGSGMAVPVGSDDSGLLWFFEADNWEMLIKVLDGCAINDRFWVFAAATTTVEYTLRVTDTVLGTVAEYFNPLGTAAAAITDTDAFATCSAAAGNAGRPPAIEVMSRTSGAPPPVVSSTGLELKGTCVPSLTDMCLSDNRFLVEVDWRDHVGQVGSGQVVGAGSSDSGLFWFFNAPNWEMLVKVLNACEVNGRFWMLAAATTDVEYTLRITDTVTGELREYFNPLGNAAAALVDTFETCP